MDNLKKIGLSALAGTLASLSAQAGELTVTGSAEVSYVQRDSDELTGNPIGMNKNIAFAGSGELDNGWTVSISQGTNDAMGFSSASVTIGMGSLGTIIVDGGTGADIGNALDNVVPTAFEEADAGFSTGLVDSGGVIGNHGSIRYALPEFSGAKLYVGYIPRNNSAASADGATAEGGKSAYEVGADFSPEMVPGLRIGGVIGKADSAGGQGGKDLDEETYFATYTWGPMSIGYQVAEEDNGTKSYDTDIYGVSFNVNDALSVSYQYGETSGYGGAGDVAEYEGISAAYNIGPMAIKFTDNSVKNQAGITTGVSADDNNRELNLSMSF